MLFNIIRRIKQRLMFIGFGLYVSLLLLAYHPINAIIQTAFIVLMIAIGLNGGKMSNRQARGRDSRNPYPKPTGTWHVELAFPLIWIAIFANIYFWWMKTPDLLPLPIPYIKIVVVFLIIQISVWITPHLTTIGRILRYYLRRRNRLKYKRGIIASKVKVS